MSPSEPNPSLDGPPQGVVRFGSFELDLQTAELRRNGYAIRLQDQPARLLVVLVLASGRLVPRDELRQRLWPADTFVEFDASLNTAVRKIRQALGDSADEPRFIETVPRKGYRFIASTQFVSPVPVARPVLVMPAPSAEPEEAEEGEPQYTPPPASPAIVQPDGGIPRRPVLAMVGGAIALGAAGFTGITQWNRRRAISASASGTPASSSFDLPPDLLFRVSFGTTLAISSDGSTMGFVVTGEKDDLSSIYLRSVDGGDFEKVPGTQSAYALILSPDGQSLVFRRNGYLVRLDRKNGNTTKLAQIHGGPEAGFWAPDNMIYYSCPITSHQDKLTSVWRVPVDGSKPPELLMADDHPELGSLWILPLQMLPDRRRLLVSRFRNPDRTLAAFDLRTGTSQNILEGVNGGHCLPTGHVIHHRGTLLFAQRMESDKLTAKGAPIVLRRDVAQASWSGANLAFADNGTLIYHRREREIPDRLLVWVDLSGRETPLGFPPGPYEPVEVSPDGRQVLMRRFDPTEGLWSLWLMNLSSGEWREVAPGQREPLEAVWTGDGRGVVLSAARKGLTRRSVAQLNEARSLTVEPNFAQVPSPMFPGHNFLTFTEGFRPMDGTWIRVMPLEGSEHPETIFKAAMHPAVSPDGKWFAVVIGRRVLVLPFPIPAGATPIEVGFGTSPLWSPDGKSLFWREGRKLMAARFTAQAAVKFSNHRVLAQDDFVAADRWCRRLTFSPKDGRFLMARNERPQAPDRTVTVVRHWFSEVRKLIPS